MRKLSGWRSLSFILWIVVTIFALTTMPDLDQLVREKGKIKLPESAQSNVAISLTKEMSTEKRDVYDIIAVFNSGKDQPLQAEQNNVINSTIQALKDNKEKLGITKITSHLDNEEVKKQLSSKDGTTILTQFSVLKSDDMNKVKTEIRHFLDEQLKGSHHVQSYLTGSSLIELDFSNSTQEGVKKTELIAIIFILIILSLVFKSPVAPLVSLITVGVSYLVSLSVVAHLVDSFNFPFSSFTQVFLVVVLFGVGTDYNILLYTRFKEELSSGQTNKSAMTATLRSAGKTVIFSGIAVLIGFVSLGLANFKLYQSTSAVAIGVGVLLIVLLTLNAFFMELLGKKLFFPMKKFKSHGESKLWAWLAKNSIARPIRSILLVLLLLVPFIINYTGNLNFNDLWEVSDKYESKQGVNVIEDHFSPGFSAPATLFIQAKGELNQPNDLQKIDELTEKISKIKGVAEVYSVTRPTSEKIQKLYINDQTKQLNTGLNAANDGINKINEGITSADGQLKNNQVNDIAKIQDMIQGTADMKNGVSKLKGALDQLATGMSSGASGAEQIKEGLSSLNQNVDLLSKSTTQLYEGYHQLENGLSTYEQYFQTIAQALSGATQGYQQIDNLMKNLISEKPELANDNNINQTILISKTAQEQLTQLSTQFSQLTKQHQSAMQSFKAANDSLLQVNTGMKQIYGGIEKLQGGSADLSKGLNQGVTGLKQISKKSAQMESGLTQINEGQKQLYSGLNKLQGKMGELQSGLTKSTDGLSKVSSGLTDAQNYLAELSSSQSSEKFYITKEVLEGKQFKTSLDMYMSPDMRTTKMIIILDQNPYSRQAMPIIDEIYAQTNGTLSGTELSDTNIAIGGITARNVDLQHISQSDFTRTAIIMMLGIMIVLMIITRSFKNSIFIIMSLILVYFSSLGISELISKHIFGIDLLSWNVPFFSFIMIVALGVDYSIFLMMSFNELEGESSERIVKASRHIGTVVISAALILGGTFAALIPSGVLTLIQVAFVVIVGLALLSFIAMPILLPALIKVSSIQNWKLGKSKTTEQEGNITTSNDL